MNGKNLSLNFKSKLESEKKLLERINELAKSKDNKPNK